MSLKPRCPECNSSNVILWDDGYICCDCGSEFDDPHDKKGNRDEFEGSGEPEDEPDEE